MTLFVGRMFFFVFVGCRESKSSQGAGVALAGQGSYGRDAQLEKPFGLPAGLGPSGRRAAAVAPLGSQKEGPVWGHPKAILGGLPVFVGGLPHVWVDPEFKKRSDVSNGPYLLLIPVPTQVTAYFDSSCK